MFDVSVCFIELTLLNDTTFSRIQAGHFQVISYSAKSNDPIGDVKTWR